MSWWYVLQVKPGREHQAKYALSLSGIYATIPREMRWIRSSGNWYQQERLFFPCYLFVRLEQPVDDESYHLLTQSEDVLRLLGQGRCPLPSHEAKYIEWLSNGGEVILPTDIYTRYFGGKRRMFYMEGFLDKVRNRVYKYDWHRRRAVIAIPFHGEMKEIEVSITPWMLDSLQKMPI